MKTHYCAGTFKPPCVKNMLIKLCLWKFFWCLYNIVCLGIVPLYVQISYCYMHVSQHNTLTVHVSHHPYVTSTCLITLTSRPRVSSSLRYVHVSHHHYVTSMHLIILTLLHVSHHPYATPTCLIILLCYLHVSQHPTVFPACVSSSYCVSGMCLIILLRCLHASRYPTVSSVCLNVLMC